MKLYHTPRTRSARVLWTAYELGLKLDIVPIDLRAGEGQATAYKARHPHGKVPTMEVDGQALIESGAIALHLAMRHGSGSGFLPDLATPAGAKVLQWSFYAAATLDEPTIEAYLQAHFVPDDKRKQEIIERAAQSWRETVTPFLSQQLGDHDYMLGADFTFADVMIGYIAYYAGKMGWLDDVLTAYVGRIEQRPGFTASFSVS